MNKGNDARKKVRGEKGKKKRSIVWKHFEVSAVSLDDGSTEFATCKYCQVRYKCSQNGKNLGITNLRDHLKEKHKEVKLESDAAVHADFVICFLKELNNACHYHLSI